MIAVFAANRTGNPGDSHQSGDLVAAHRVAGAPHRMPYFADLVDTSLADKLQVDSVRVAGQLCCRGRARLFTDVIGGRGDLHPMLGEHSADRNDRRTNWSL